MIEFIIGNWIDSFINLSDQTGQADIRFGRNGVHTLHSYIYKFFHTCKIFLLLPIKLNKQTTNNIFLSCGISLLKAQHISTFTKYYKSCIN